MSGALSDADGATLLTLARVAIAARLHDDGSLDRLLATTCLTDPLRAPRAAFVTLKTDGDDGADTLRGCIGTLDATTPLYRNVIQAAPQAALSDPRFPPLRVDELPRVRIEVSALTPAVPLEDVAALVLGRDGVRLEQGDRNALFLPQVGAERDWSVEEFLANLAVKAGLPRDGWRRSRLSVFRVEAFHERRD